MAKALLGHVGSVERQAIQELSRARGMLRALEFELDRLRTENDRLAEALARAGDGLKPQT